MLQWNNAAFHQGLHYLQRQIQPSEKGIHKIFLEIVLNSQLTFQFNSIQFFITLG